jgi:MFS family permease
VTTTDVQRRTLRVLTVGQVIGAAALAAAVTVGAFVVQDLLGDDTPWAGVATATSTTGTAVMSQLLARRMHRLGRRPGLQLGYGLAAAGAVVAAVGAESRQLMLFLAGLFLYGSGQAGNLLARYAATDLAEPNERGRAMSRIVFASTFGAVFGPLVTGPAQRAGEAWFGLGRYTGPWLLAAVCFSLAAINIALRLRPDPLLVARSMDRDGAIPPGAKLRSALRVISDRPDARLALGAMVVAQSTMVAVMAMTPVHLKLHGHETISQFVVSLHIAGMYAFSPLVGRFSDQRGRIPAILVGSGLLVAATAMAAVSGDVEQLLFPSLWLLGIGWNFGLIGGSSLLVDAVPTEHRVAVQGSADLMMSLCGGMAGFASGFIRRAIGYHLLSVLALGLALVLAAATVRATPTAMQRTARPAAR